MSKTPLCVLATGLVLGSMAEATPVPLQSATATFSQTFDRNYFITEAIDGNYADRNGWAIFNNGVTSAQTAAFETTTDLTAPAVQVKLVHNFLSGLHQVGRFRISTTTDDRSTFADGLVTGGDVTANWTVLMPTSVTAGSMNSTILGDGSILMANADGLTDYEVLFNAPVSGVTGFRLEVMEDASLPTGGPGMHPTNGNFVVTEFEVHAVPEPTTLSVLVGGLMVAIRRRRR